ncbi:GtrA family protein (plasmid) [Klebsiella pneumoniae]|uniref:GtrA family protein n=1 Tax=Klebsiella pneumoniae TaxID=573 RepID=UPI003985DFBF
MLIDLFFLNQAIANFLAFFIAVTFSFFANAKWTFMARATSGLSLIFIVHGFYGGFFWACI